MLCKVLKKCLFGLWQFICRMPGSLREAWVSLREISGEGPKPGSGTPAF